MAAREATRLATDPDDKGRVALLSETAPIVVTTPVANANPLSNASPTFTDPTPVTKRQITLEEVDSELCPVALEEVVSEPREVALVKVASKYHPAATIPKATAGAPSPGAENTATRTAVPPPLAPPDSTTKEARLLGDLGHERLPGALIQASRRPPTQDQLDRLRARGLVLLARVQCRYGSVPMGPGGPDGPSYDAPQRRCPVLACRQLRAHTSTPAGEDATAARARTNLGPYGVGALNGLISGKTTTQSRVFSLHGSAQPIPGG